MPELEGKKARESFIRRVRINKSKIHDIYESVYELMKLASMNKESQVYVISLKLEDYVNEISSILSDMLDFSIGIPTGALGKKMKMITFDKNCPECNTSFAPRNPAETHCAICRSNIKLRSF